MPVLKLVVVIAVSLFLLAIFRTVLPIDGNMVKLINVAMLVFLLLYILAAVGLLGKIPGTSIEW